MPQRLIFNLGGKPGRATPSSSPVLLIGLLGVLAVYWYVSRPAGPQQTIPYSGLLIQQIAKNRSTLYAQKVKNLTDMVQQDLESRLHERAAANKPK